MRIGVVCGAGIVSGKEIMSLELGAGLRRLGHEVDYLTATWGNGDFARRAREAGFHVRRLRLGFISATPSLDAIRMTAHQMIYWPSLIAGFLKFAQERGPRWIIHTNWHHLLLLVPVLRPGRDLFWVHEILPDNLHLRVVLRLIDSRIALFIAVSSAVARSLEKLGVSALKIRTIHNGIADPAGELSVAPESQVQLPLRVGIVGQIGAWKGHQDLFVAFSELLRVHSNSELHVYGTGDPGFESELKQAAKKLQVVEQLVWHGFVSDRASIYPRLDVLVVPSRSEDPFPTCALEAAFFGIPVIATRRGGLPEIVVEGETGFLADSHAPSQLAQRLLALGNSPSVLRRMGKNARVRALQNFSRDRFVSAFNELLTSKDK